MAFALNLRRITFALLAIAATATMVWFGTGLFPMWPLLWFAPLPVLLVAARTSWWTAALVAFLAWATGSLNMYHYFSTALHIPLSGCLTIVTGPALFFTLAVLLYRALLRRGAFWTALIAFPAAWVTFEYIFNLTSPHGTAISLSYSQLRFLPILQLASVTGPWGISFVLLSFSSALALAIHLGNEKPQQATRIAVATAAMIALVLGFGGIRLASKSNPADEVKVGLVASDAPGNTGVAQPGPDVDRLFKDYASHISALAAQGARIVVIPEDLAVVIDSNNAAADSIFQPIADQTGATIVVGMGHIVKPLRYNEARVYQPSIASLRYAKHHLLPPFENIFTPGATMVMLDKSPAKWGIEICKDMDFTQLSRSYGNDGAGLILAPAWDFNLDRVSHGHIAIMRGVESGFSIARAARGGYLTVSDDHGRILAETESNSAPFATLLANVPDTHDQTLYLLLGDWFAWLVLALLIFSLAQLIRLRSRRSGQAFALPAVPSTQSA